MTDNVYKTYLIVGTGGFLGAVARYAIGGWFGKRWGISFPWGTLFINVSGCFLIAFLMSILTERYMFNPHWRLFLVVGFLGAYTTFSTFEYETGQLLKGGEFLYAALNVSLSVVIGFIALKSGETLAKLI
ncbi:MAG: fluoride efflux transporter CrcB [Nitrospirae bacterium]|nr:fluoride efflux transporter CrcB [Nitrospirota bacterium]